jgi:hypothetical protein
MILAILPTKNKKSIWGFRSSPLDLWDQQTKPCWDCGYNNPFGICDSGWQNVSCTSIKQCLAVDPKATCGAPMQCLGGYCQSTLAHKVNGDIKGVLCFRNATTRNRTVAAGGVQLRLNTETFVVSDVSVEVPQGTI